MTGSNCWLTFENAGRIPQSIKRRSKLPNPRKKQTHRTRTLRGRRVPSPVQKASGTRNGIIGVFPKHLESSIVGKCSRIWRLNISGKQNHCGSEATKENCGRGKLRRL